MLHYNTVKPKTLELLINLQKLDFLSESRLVGGTSLALQFGHRESIDLDLFGNIVAKTDEIRSEFSKVGKTEIISASKNINIFSVDNIKTDVVNYPFKWLFPAINTDNIIMADIRDIAAMKLSAITNRGSKKDFIDIYYILKQYTFSEILTFYEKKYNEASPFLLLKSLIYFNDAEKEPMPKMKDKIDWNRIKSTIRLEVKKYI